MGQGRNGIDIVLRVCMTQWHSHNRRKYLLQYHLIFVCKYRKNLLSLSAVSDEVKRLSSVICERHNVQIRYMETDKNHIHYMIETGPEISISKVVALLKSFTTYWLWKSFDSILNKEFWKERTFWTDGYFVCSVGNVSEKMLKEYIENQG